MDLLPIEQRLAAAVRTARREAEVTQADLAYRAGMVRTSVVMIEGGKQSMSVAQLCGIAKALGLQPWALLRRAQ